LKTTTKTIDSVAHLPRESHYHPHDDHDQGGQHGADHDGHDYKTGTAEYARLGVLAIIIVASLTGWWRPFMNRDWLAFASTVIGGFPI
jgi:hypothetical protein